MRIPRQPVFVLQNFVALFFRLHILFAAHKLEGLVSPSVLPSCLSCSWIKLLLFLRNNKREARKTFSDFSLVLAGISSRSCINRIANRMNSAPKELKGRKTAAIIKFQSSPGLEPVTTSSLTMMLVNLANSRSWHKQESFTVLDHVQVTSARNLGCITVDVSLEKEFLW